MSYVFKVCKFSELCTLYEVNKLYELHELYKCFMNHLKSNEIAWNMFLFFKNFEFFLL